MIKEVTLVGSKQDIAAYRLAGVVNSIDVEEDDLPDKVKGCEGLVFLTPDADARLKDKYGDLGEDLIIAKIPYPGEYNRINEIIKDTIGFELRR